MSSDYKYDNSIIHETIIRDVIDLIQGVRDSDEIKMMQDRGHSFKSIASASNNFILVFPVACSKNVNIENASMITKAIERKAVSMLQILFSAITISDSEDASEFLRNFHTNLKSDEDITVDNFIDTLDKYVMKNESVRISNMDLYDLTKRDLQNLSNYLPDSISEHSLNRFKLTKRFNGKLEIYDEADNGKAAFASYVNKNQKEVSGIRKDNVEMINKQLINSDVKKANELVPTMMIVNFTTIKDGLPIARQLVIGIKAKLYPLNSMDIINRISLKNKDNHGLLKFIKASTREISFCRDFLFAIDKAKLDALSQSKRGSSSSLWKLLERRALKSKIRRALSQVNDASAITTLVVTREEVDYLKKTENIDLEDPKTTAAIMESYNFMCFVIIDEILEAAQFLYDTGENRFETMSFSKLERETGDNNMKKIINLMNKVSR